MRTFTNLNIAIEAISANLFRAFLTCLGILFGVAAVIAMLAIGNGAQEEIMEQLKNVGVNNIVIESVWQSEEKEQDQSANEAIPKKSFSPGLSIEDVQSIKKYIPSIAKLSPEIEINTVAYGDAGKKDIKLLGVENAFFEIFPTKLENGQFFSLFQEEQGSNVCIIGKSLENKLFGGTSALGKKIKCGQHWLTVIGILEKRADANKNGQQNIGLANKDFTVFIPLKTMLLRFKNRSLVTRSKLEQARMNDFSPDNGSTEGQVKTNYHQLDRLVVQVQDAQYLESTAEVLGKLLKRRHLEIEDFKITVPELLLKQQQRTKDIFNIVLGAIAGISLLVGGIGIMNIMLASVLERIREIGLRMSLGARRKDIVYQFLFESVLISVTGGLLGILLGVFLAKAIASIAAIKTLVSLSSILVSFLVSVSVGLLFGIAPAQKAAKQDPIESLRYQ